MTMPPIRERYFTMLSEGLPKPIGIRLTDLQSGFGCGCSPRVACLHLSHQLDFDYMALSFIHVFSSHETMQSQVLIHFGSFFLNQRSGTRQSVREVLEVYHVDCRRFF